ncbi:DUF6157 family protein [Microbacterium sp. NPDC008134]|uniref:DUF6157 family protein n=1 Tax=Microbacterium sp. NPDC008134 TaxID=3364183 RepID=UPI0036EDA77E
MAHTTNYFDTFIEVAEDCPTEHAQEPPIAESPSIAALHYRLIAEQPYSRTSDDVIFETYALRAGVAVDDALERALFFSMGRPCLRSSPLGKRYGWGLHHDDQGRVALVARESDEYALRAADPDIAHTRAMRSKRA